MMDEFKTYMGIREYSKHGNYGLGEQNFSVKE